ncbi:MAG: J domain-containing protein [Candidatus Acidiferrales bacterium]
MIKDYYHLLGLPRGAPLEDIKAAYRKLAAQCHPDKVAGLAPEFQEMANAKMLELNEVMGIFSDPGRRAKYDEVIELIPERQPEPARPVATPPSPPAPLTESPPEGPASESLVPASSPEPPEAPAPQPRAATPPPSAGREIWLEQQGRELKVGLKQVLKWRETKGRGWQWMMEAGDWRRTLLVAHRHFENLSLLSVRSVLTALESLLGDRTFTTKGTTIIVVISFQHLMDAQIVTGQIQAAVEGKRGLFKTVTPLVVLHDAKSQRMTLFGKPTEYPETRRVVQYLLAGRTG